ncbi:MAG: putative DNA binding domain-containing protein [Muribaculaceae bacterium]|nr:putative DNA binding domain-containing protein [Muribaculaceae bacterium]
MTEIELQTYLKERFPCENEACDWKEFKSLKNCFNGKEGDDIISYVAAISSMDGGHLVIGVKDHSLDIVGTDTYNYERQAATMRLVRECSNLPAEGLKIEEFITSDTNKMVWVINIPKHMPRLPVYAHKKLWQRIEDNLVEMTSSRRDKILAEPLAIDDWSAEIIPDATIDDLDPRAIAVAREKFKELFNGSRDAEIDSWTDEVFLNKAKLTKKSAITRTTIILLGKSESDHYLNPSICKIRWFLRDEKDGNKDFRVFTIPMILAIDELGSLIRNTTYTYTISGSMFPESMSRYDAFTLREPLNNAIAHQDYSKGCHIDVIEYEDEKLSFKNAGEFIPESVEAVVTNDFPESHYRNPALVEAMRNVKMVETEGGGIKKLFMQQRRRFFPMPEYDIKDSHVVCTIEGRVLDENFANILVSNSSLSLADILLLDYVQKGSVISHDEANYLRKKGFVEGRYPNLFLSSKIVSSTRHIGLKTSYIKNKSFDDDYFKKLIMEYIKEFGKAERRDINALINNKLPEYLTDRQRYDKITTLLSALKRKKILIYDGKYWLFVK